MRRFCALFLLERNFRRSKTSTQPYCGEEGREEWRDGHKEGWKKEEKKRRAGSKDTYSLLKVFEYCFHLSLMHHSKCP